MNRNESIILFGRANESFTYFPTAICFIAAILINFHILLDMSEQRLKF